MKVLILGMDGYLGWSLTNYLTARDFEVAGVDNFARRNWVADMDSDSAIPIAPMEFRSMAYQEKWGKPLRFWEIDIADYHKLSAVIKTFMPDAIVHLGECPSAPYSMRDVWSAQFVQKNNILGTLAVLFAMKDICPEAHLVKLATMGEYGTPNIAIPEGYFEIEYRGRKDTLPFPKQAGSYYHLTKVHDTANIAFACRIWKLRATDIMQGVVYGTHLEEFGDDPDMRTRLDIDEAFGTVINRYCCQAVIGEPITVFGRGGQTRGFLPLEDSMECMTIAIENPPMEGEHRVLNQFEQIFSVKKLAEIVAEQALKLQLGDKIEIRHIGNPRIEAEEHYYNPDRKRLLDLGYEPDFNIDRDIYLMLEDLTQFSNNIYSLRHVLLPWIWWDDRWKS